MKSVELTRQKPLINPYKPDHEKAPVQTYIAQPPVQRPRPAPVTPAVSVPEATAETRRGPEPQPEPLAFSDSAQGERSSRPVICDAIDRVLDHEPEPEKPDCALIGQDGNIFNLVGIAARTLREHGLSDQAKEMKDRVFASGSYGEALCIIGEYVNITDTEQERKPSLRQQLKETKTAEPSARPKPEKQQER